MWSNHLEKKLAVGEDYEQVVISQHDKMAKRVKAALASNEQRLQKEGLKKLLLFVTSSRWSLLGIVTISSLNTLARMLINTNGSEIVPPEENLPRGDHLKINLTTSKKGHREEQNTA